MAHVTTSRQTGWHNLPLISRFAEIVEHFQEAFELNREFRNTLRELSALSDRELSDLGIHRENVVQVAWDAAVQITDARKAN
ncbi:MAG: DUF1127 domain-containing protein [Pseudomonadota bacterium]